MASRFVKLTPAALKALLPGQAIEEHGIKVQRTKSGDLRYVIAAMVDGKRISRAMGMASAGVTRQQCEAALEVLRTRAREDRLDLPKGRKTAPKFKEEAVRYIEHLERGVGEGVDRKRQHLTARLVPQLGEYRFSAVPVTAINEFVAARRAEGAKDSTINRELATLSHLFRSANKWGWIGKDAIPFIPRLSEDNGRRVVLNQAEATALVQAAYNDPDPDVGLFVMVGLHTAMRHGEARRLRWENLDLHRKRFFIPQAKAGQREQPITTELACELSRIRSMRGEATGYLFKGGAGSSTGYRHTFRKAFQRSVVRAELDPATVTPHVLRHTAITRLVKAGVDLPTVQRVSGHKTLSMVLRYSHVDGVHIDNAMTALES
ncbi:Site-specific recombinase XerD [Sphingomonas palmae]|uniref:Site-specific recombinase XerD n=1 Tax=Sphingomonas palmae TaxID=1855283 RepID=A0A1H7MJ37_9SPHN|nr:site-specific integrase [Sphingomonas palmae]SEL11330.1 Site-specific recombinase XerD [Sphingomonas palmae]